MEEVELVEHVEEEVQHVEEEVQHVEEEVQHVEEEVHHVEVEMQHVDKRERDHVNRFNCFFQGLTESGFCIICTRYSKPGGFGSGFIY